MNKIRLQLLTIVLLSSHALHAQDRYLKLDSLLTARYHNQKFSGVVIVAENEEITYANALGYADYNQKIPLNLHTQFDLSSGSKLFTAVAIAQLVEQHKLSFHTKVKEYFPELTFAADVDVHQLMTHSSGLGNFQTVEGFSYQNVNSCLDALPFIEDQPLRCEPGDRVYYATSNLLVLGQWWRKYRDSRFQNTSRKTSWKNSAWTERLLTPISMFRIMRDAMVGLPGDTLKMRKSKQLKRIGMKMKERM